MTQADEMFQHSRDWRSAIPSHWLTVRFRHVASIEGTLVDPRQEPWSSMPMLAPNHVEKDTGRVLAIETALEQGADSSKYPIRAGQVVYSKIRPALNKVAIAPVDGTCSADMYPVHFTERVDARFAWYFMRARPFHDFAKVTSMRVKMPKINREDLADAPWALPPLPEQRAIADYLDRESAQIDTLIEEQRRLILLAEERRRAVVREGIHPATSWAHMRIKHVGETSLGKMLDAGRKTREGDQPAPYVRAADILPDGSINLHGLNSMPYSATELASLNLRKDDILLIEGGATVGRPGHLQHDVPGTSFQKTVNRLRVRDGAHARFVYWVLNDRYHSGYYANHFSSVSFVHLTGEKLREVEIALPSYEEQVERANQIDRQTSTIDALISETTELVRLAQERRTALITAAVTGQIAIVA